MDLPTVLLVLCCEVTRCDEVMRKGKVVACSAKVAAAGRQAATATPGRCTDDASDAVDAMRIEGTYGRSAWCGPLLVMWMCCVLMEMLRLWSGAVWWMREGGGRVGEVNK